MVARDRRGNVALIGALSLPLLFGFGALAYDINRALSQRVQDQMVSDAVALSAAIAYSQGGQDSSVLTPAAQTIAAANGISAGNVSVALVNNYPASGSKAVKAIVTVPVPISLGRAIGMSGNVNVTSTSYASITSGPTFQPCFLALSSDASAIATSGGASINLNGCDAAAVGGIDNEGSAIAAKNIVSSNGGVTNSWGTLSAQLIQYATSFSSPSWNSSIPDSSKIVKGSTTLTDYWAGNAALTSGRSALGNYTAPNAISDPDTQGGPNWNFSWSPSNSVAAYRTAPFSGSFVVPAGNYNIGTLNIDGGISVTFASGSTITVHKGLTIGGGSTVAFGNSNLLVNGGFSAGSGFTMGNGTLAIGSGSVSFSGANTVGDGTVTINAPVTLSGGSTMTMGAGNHAFKNLTIGGGSWLKLGNGDLDVTSGISVGGGSTMVAGTGDYRLGANSSGNSITLAGSAVLITGDGQFSTAGSITTAGGSRLVIGSTTNHYINGNLSIAGSVLFGEGAYTVNGNFTNGTGGTTWPYYDPVSGQTYGQTLQGVSVSGYDMAGVDVTFLLKGTVNLGGGAKTLLIAPDSSVSGGMIQDLLIDSLTTSATNWGAGAQNTFAGSVHLPNSAVTMSGGSTTLSSGQCFMLTASTITVSGGAATGTTCSSVSQAASGQAGTIRLVG